MLTNSLVRKGILGSIALISGFCTLFGIAQPIYAHHAMDGQLPTNFLQGFLSGLAHPVIGLDHLAFVVAIGIISAALIDGVWIPGVFVLAAMTGTGIHLLGLDLPLAEFAISLSVIVLGAILLLNRQLNFSWIAVLVAGAGMFHGYAYGESIVGAEMTPLVAYLAGFSLIQYAIAVSMLKLSQMIASTTLKRWAGFGITVIGAMFFATAIAG